MHIVQEGGEEGRRAAWQLARNMALAPATGGWVVPPGLQLGGAARAAATRLHAATAGTQGCMRHYREAPDDSAAPLARKKSSKAVAATRLRTSAAGRPPQCAAAWYVSAAWAGGEERAGDEGAVRDMVLACLLRLVTAAGRGCGAVAFPLLAAAFLKHLITVSQTPAYPPFHSHPQSCRPSLSLARPPAPCRPPAAAPPARE